MPVSLVAALGNPGSSYEATRHNIAWIFLDHWAAPLRPTWNRDRRHQAEIAKVTFDDRTLWLVKPLTFMNDSGRAVQSLGSFFKIPPTQMLIAYDELQLPLGGLKISQKGSAGGHNGLASVIAHLGGDFLRLRLGIGNRPDRRMDLKDWVLGRFTTEERVTLETAMPKWSVALNDLLRLGPEAAMNRHNQKPPKPKPPPAETGDSASPPPQPSKPLS